MEPIPSESQARRNPTTGSIEKIINSNLSPSPKRTDETEKNTDCHAWKRINRLFRSAGIARRIMAGIRPTYASAPRIFSRGSLAADSSAITDWPQAGQKALTSGMGASQLEQIIFFSIL